jgi:hypothetical protein
MRERGGLGEGQNVEVRTVLSKSYKEIKCRELRNVARKVVKEKVIDEEEGGRMMLDPDKQVDEQSIVALREDGYSLAFLLENIQNKEGENIIQIAMLTKIIAIFERFSLFEEAILFAMTLADPKTLDRLIE